MFVQKVEAFLTLSIVPKQTDAEIQPSNAKRRLIASSHAAQSVLVSPAQFADLPKPTYVSTVMGLNRALPLQFTASFRAR